MPRRRVRSLSGALCLTIGFLLALASLSDTALARKRAAWQLVDYAQSVCVKTGSGGTSYFGIWIKGRWTHSINAGVSDAPAGSTSWGSYLPIAPGSSDGVGSLAYVVLQIAASTPMDTYSLGLWADDGTTRQSVPVTLVVADSCGY